MRDDWGRGIKGDTRSLDYVSLVLLKQILGLNPHRHSQRISHNHASDSRKRQ